MGDRVESNNKLFAVMAWLQLVIGVLLATAMMWGYPSAYDLLYIVCDDGLGIELFIPKAIDIPELIAMSKRLAVPGTL